MNLEISDQQLDEMRRGEAVSVRSPGLAEPLLILPQSEFAAAVLAVIRGVRRRSGEQVTDDELKEDIEDALVRGAWAEMGESTRDDWARENPY